MGLPTLFLRRIVFCISAPSPFAFFLILFSPSLVSSRMDRATVGRCRSLSLLSFYPSSHLYLYNLSQCGDEAYKSSSRVACIRKRVGEKEHKEWRPSECACRERRPMPIRADGGAGGGHGAVQGGDPAAAHDGLHQRRALRHAGAAHPPQSSSRRAHCTREAGVVEMEPWPQSIRAAFRRRSVVMLRDGFDGGARYRARACGTGRRPPGPEVGGEGRARRAPVRARSRAAWGRRACAAYCTRAAGGGESGPW
jgi:hypothetical protein